MATTGQLLWETVLGDRVESSACVTLCGKYVAVGCYDGYVYILCVPTGKIAWQFQTGDIVKSSPTIDPLTSYIWFGSHDKHVYSLDFKNKVCKLKKNLNSGSIFSSPCISVNPHIVYITTLGGHLFALNPINGVVQWEFDIQKPLFASPCITSKGVLIGCVNEYLYHIHQEGYLIWKINTGGSIFASPNCLSVHQENAQEVIVCCSYNHCIFCYTIDGELCWKTNVYSRIYATPFIFTKSYPSNAFASKHFLTLPLKIYLETSENTNNDSSASRSLQVSEKVICGEHAAVVCSTDGNVHVLCMTCGCALTKFGLPGEVFSSPVIYEKNIFVGCRDDKVYCLTFNDY